MVVLVSGGGTNLAALLDATSASDYPADVVGVGSDRTGSPALDRAAAADIETFVVPPDQHPSRAAWDLALADATAVYRPDLVVLAGFMRLVGPVFLERFPQRVINTHPALSPCFPGHARTARSARARCQGDRLHDLHRRRRCRHRPDRRAGRGTGARRRRRRDACTNASRSRSAALLVRMVADLVTHHYRIEGRKVVRT